jgi:hypothetical protein
MLTALNKIHQVPTHEETIEGGRGKPGRRKVD